MGKTVQSSFVMASLVHRLVCSHAYCTREGHLVFSAIFFFHNFDQTDPIHAPEDFLIMFPAMGAVLELLLWHCSAIPVHEMLFHFWLKAVNSFSSPVTVHERKSSPSISYQASIATALLFFATSFLMLAI